MVSREGPPAQDLVQSAFPFSTMRTRKPQAVALSLLERPVHGAAAGVPFNVPWSKKKQQEMPKDSQV